MSVMWFRQDLRLHDNPALLAAVDAAVHDGGTVVPLVVVTPQWWQALGPVQRAYLTASLRALDTSIDGRLLVRWGDPSQVVPEVARASGARSVHIANDVRPRGQVRDDAVAHALGDIALVRTGSPYAVAPGAIRKADGTPYRVFTPYYRAWLEHGWHAPAPDIPPDVPWHRPQPGDALPDAPVPEGMQLPEAGEAAAWVQWERFRGHAATYGDVRDRPDLDKTSRMSTPLHFGEVHPRSLLAEVGEPEQAWVRQLCWRDFYADVLFHNPQTAHASLDARFDEPTLWSDDAAAFDAWAHGRTGYPFVDAAMRQLRREGWMHNRVRMVVASFLVKDLHLPWQWGAAEFMRWLTDADTANNAHGWQWTAGCGTDASPYHRVFNPVLQGLKFDPDGDYVRRYVPELRHLAGATVHEPWAQVDGYAHGYPERIVDHAVERVEALALLERMRGH